MRIDPIHKHRTRLFTVTLFLWIVFTVSAAFALTKDEENNIDVYKNAAKGVVNITSIVVERDFFHRPIPREGAGSGMIIDAKGHILTNSHVIKEAHRIEVTLSDGSRWPGRLVGNDPDNDLAIIHIDASAESLKPLPMGDSSNLAVGQKVLAIGNPFGLNETLTTGIISSIGRSIRSPNGTLLEGLIQTDAAINLGNSGGPLLDSKGKIIGINTAIFSPSGGSVGIGFAIPIDTAKQLIPELIERGYVSHPWMGVTLFSVTPGVAQALELGVDRGVLIVEVFRGGPAYSSGLRGSSKILLVGNVMLPAGGDVIVAVDKEPVHTMDELARALRKLRPGDTTTVKILRERRFLNVQVVLGERPR
ncbi:MAG: trypsin-like peptidase domain-containing protein [Deltaproteobacteria bacterium]|nr:trypsin-like peptidase domain-containing protein [Deltaproteobacteria bacterium]